MGPYDLNEKATDSLFTEDGIIGNYAYGEIAPTDGAFIVKYVGPSDGDLRNHIKTVLANTRSSNIVWLIM